MADMEKVLAAFAKADEELNSIAAEHVATYQKIADAILRVYEAKRDTFRELATQIQKIEEMKNADQ